MKKILAMLLMAVMCFALVACGGNETTDGDNSRENNQTDNKTIAESEIKEYLSVSDITTDNWQNFYSIKEDEIGEQGDKSLRVIPLSTKIIPQDVILHFRYNLTETYIEPKENGGNLESVKYKGIKECDIEDDAFAITSKSISYTYQKWSNGCYTKYEITDLVCTEATGTIITCLVPDEYWYEDEKGQRYFDITTDDDGNRRIFENDLGWLEDYIQ